MATIVIGDKEVTVGDEFLSMPEADQHKAIDEIAAHIGGQSTALGATPAKDEGMPTRSLSQRLSMAKTGRLPPEANSVGEAAAAFGREAIKGTLGTPGEIAKILSDYSPATLLGITPKGLTEPYIPTSEKVGEMFNLGQTPPQYGGYGLMGSLVGPSAIAEGAGLATRGVRSAIEAGRNFFNPTANALITATGGKAPEIVNALRAGTPGLETAGSAAAPVGSVEFSKFAKGLEPYAAQTNADITKVKDAVLGGNAASVETAANDAAKTVASDIAKPDVQKTGQNLIDIAEKEKEFSSKKIVKPEFDAAEASANGAGTDISNLLNKANELTDTINKDAADILSRKLTKFQGKTTTPEYMGPGGATFKGKPVTAAPMATLEDIGDIRETINDALAVAKTKGSGSDVNRLQQLHDEVTAAVVNSTTLSQETKDLYFGAVKTYKDLHATRFKTGAQATLFKTRDGVPGIQPTKVIDKFFNNADSTDQFVALFGKNPSAMSEAQKGMEGLFRDSVIKDGVVDPKKYTKFMEDYGPQIDKLDATGLNIRSKLDTVVADTKTALAPKTAVEEIRSSINQKPLPAGANADEIALRAQALSSALPPDELEKALQIARRGQEYDRLAMGKTSAASEVPISKPIGFTPLEWGKRVFVEAMKKVGSKLSDKLTAQLAEQFTNPHQAADVIEQAIKYRAAQDARKAATTAKVDIFTNTVNKLAPASATVNALTEQRR